MNTSFTNYLWHRMPTKDLAIMVMEVSELFPRTQINELFRQEIKKLIRGAKEPGLIDGLVAFLQMDHVAYIDRAVRNAGVRDPDIDPMVQDLVVKLLTGGLFSKYRGQPIAARFKVAVTNAIRTLAMRRNRIQKRFTQLQDDVPQIERGQDQEDLLGRFRSYVMQNLGHTACQVLDQRLAGKDTKDLIGTPGLETSYRVKQVVGRIKSALRMFSSQDPEFAAVVAQAIEGENETMRRRFRRPVPTA